MSGSPLLSFVVPVHGVEPYLGRCLDSILAVDAVDIELIAVDDASPDGCGAILDAYAERDRRMRVLHLPENVGLGPARNAGLAEARGDFVWFVDSDDWIETGAVPSLIAHLESGGSDLVLFDHQRTFDDGRPSEPSGDGPTLAELAARPALSDRRPAVWLSPFAHTRVFSRSFLESSGLRFPPGKYEDLPVTLPALATAPVVSALAVVLVSYRQRAGSITAEVSPHHLDLTDQYERVMARLEAAGAGGAELQPVVYRYMLRHLFQRLGTGTIPADLRKAFFHRSAALARRWEPAGFRARGPLEMARHRLLRRDAALVGITLQRLFQQVTGRGSRRGSPVIAAARFTRKAALIAGYRLQRLRPLDDRLALYSAYWGTQVGTCNPGAIARSAAVVAPDVRAVWVVAPGGPERGGGADSTVVHGTAAYFRALARARFYVTNVNPSDHFRRRAGQVVLQTHHGTPLKRMGADVHDGTEDVGAILRRARSWTHSLSSSPHTSEIWPRAYPVPARLLEAGQPRNDVLVQAGEDDVAEARRRAGLAVDEVAILYAPTYRADGDGSEILDVGALARRLGPGHRVLARTHHFQPLDLSGTDGSVIDARGGPIEDLYLAADLLITDYSSVMFDYAVLDRPIIVFATDWERYDSTRGTYFDVRTDGPGPFTSTFDELVEVLTSGRHLSAQAAEQRARFRARFCPWDDGRAGERIVRHLFLGEPLEPPPA